MIGGEAGAGRDLGVEVAPLERAALPQRVDQFVQFPAREFQFRRGDDAERSGAQRLDVMAMMAAGRNGAAAIADPERLRPEFGPAWIHLGASGHARLTSALQAAHQIVARSPGVAYSRLRFPADIAQAHRSRFMVDRIQRNSRARQCRRPGRWDGV